VDYDKAAEVDPLLVTLPEDVFVQYNRAESFHSGTGENKDMVTGTKMTDLRTGLKPGDRYEFLDYQSSGENSWWRLVLQ
jgi:hypothetical protein